MTKKFKICAELSELERFRASDRACYQLVLRAHISRKNNQGKFVFFGNQFIYAISIHNSSWISALTLLHVRSSLGCPISVPRCVPRFFEVSLDSLNRFDIGKIPRWSQRSALKIEIKLGLQCEIFYKKNLTWTFLRAPVEFFDEIFLKPHLLIEIYRLRMFL